MNRVSRTSAHKAGHKILFPKYVFRMQNIIYNVRWCKIYERLNVHEHNAGLTEMQNTVPQLQTLDFLNGVD